MTLSIIPAPVSPLRRRLIDDMEMRRFSNETQRNYIRDIGRFATFLGRPPDMATAEDLRRFQVEQQESGVPVPTMNSIVSALRFFFTQTLDRPDLARKLVRVAQGPTHLKAVTGALAEAGDTVPASVTEIALLFLEQIESLTRKIDDLTRKLRDISWVSEEMRRLCSVPGVGPVTAGAILAFVPELRTFNSGRNFAAWLGLVPRQRSTGGKTRLGGVCKMGQSDVRKLLIVGAMSRIRWIVRKGVFPDTWLGRVVGRKPRMVAAVALANKMARIIWAMMTREQNYRMA